VADLLAPEAAASESTGTVRVVLALPCWDDCLHTGLDDLIESASRSPMVLLSAYPACCSRTSGRRRKHSPISTPAPLDS
jgi:hypothetical protein